MQRSLRNVLVVSFGFLLLFTAFGGLQNLQSSLYSEDGMGVATLSSLYGAVLLSSMLLPPILIKQCGCKWTIVGSMCCYVAFSLGNFQASWFTLIPTSVLLGLGAAPLWSAQCTYLTVLGTWHAEKTGQLGKDVVNQYFGIFFLIFQSSGVWGNLISSLVFGQTPTGESVSEEQLESCGARDCLMVSAALNSTQGPSQPLIYMLLSVYTVSGVLAILLIAIFLEPLEDFESSRKEEQGKPTPFWTTLLSTFRLLRDGRLRLLVLLPLYSGLQQGFISGAVTHLSCIITLLLWHPRPTQMAAFFLLPSLWGLSDAVWQTQNNALYGVLFEKKKEAAFANYRLWEALGFVIAFGYSSFLCVSTKLYILLGTLTVAMLAYGLVEYQESRKIIKVLAAGEARQPAEERAQSEL
ncbi:protein unc-93 homolog A isoform 2-T2 [Thomomys bottae]